MKLAAMLLMLICLVFSVSAADPPSDDEISDRVRILLTNDKDVKGGAIEVTVNKGVVEMKGNVRTEKQRAKAEKVARKAKGVQKVVNNLKVTPSS